MLVKVPFSFLSPSSSTANHVSDSAETPSSRLKRACTHPMAPRHQCEGIHIVPRTWHSRCEEAKRCVGTWGRGGGGEGRGVQGWFGKVWVVPECWWGGGHAGGGGGGGGGRVGEAGSSVYFLLPSSTKSSTYTGDQKLAIRSTLVELQLFLSVGQCDWPTFFFYFIILAFYFGINHFSCSFDFNLFYVFQHYF